MPTLRVPLAAATLATLAASQLAAQWTNRYPRVDGYGHHVYLEGFELPTLTAGPIDPAPSPDGRSVAFASWGWIWILDLETGEARQVTRGGDLDFRPAWSPDGSRLAFVRDNDHETSIVSVDPETGDEELLVDSPALDLDPAFSADGRRLYYASAESGDLDLWRLELTSRERTRLTGERGLELRPQPDRGDRGMVYLSKAGGSDQVRWVDMTGVGGTDRVLREGSIASMARPALSPDGRTVALNWPTQDGWELRLVDVASPGPSTVRLVSGALPLTPAWSADGRTVYYSQADPRERMILKRVPAVGGGPEDVPVTAWRWAQPMGTLRIRTRVAGGPSPAPARLNVVDARGHSFVPGEGASHFDGQNGRVFFYSPGVVELLVTAGEVTVAAVQGLTTPETVSRIDVAPGAVTELSLDLESLWDARADGWVSGDHHFHLNYGGQYDLSPDDLVPMMRGENLDVATPLLANLHNRFEDQDLWTWERSGGPPLIRFGQEIRSHFLGHMGLIGIDDLFWPWIWGPGYQVYGRDDRPNADALDHAHRQGGMGYYVHPISVRDPFSPEGMGRVPVELVVDAVLGDVDALEVACLWSDELGTSEVWYRLLNLGIPVAPSAGTDVMTDYYRTMAVGTTRVYARTGDAVNWPAYLEALRDGRTFVTTGPMVLFEVDGAGPGEVVAPGARAASWSLTLHSAVPVERVEILVNGSVAVVETGLDEAGTKELSGTLEIGGGGWIAARVVGGETRWPAMDSYPFGHTAPVWIGERGSVDPEARRSAAAELLQVLDRAEERLDRGYAGAEIPRLEARFAEARARLEAVRGG